MKYDGIVCTAPAGGQARRGLGLPEGLSEEVRAEEVPERPHRGHERVPWRLG